MEGKSVSLKTDLEIFGHKIHFKQLYLVNICAYRAWNQIYKLLKYGVVYHASWGQYGVVHADLRAAVI